MSEYGFEPVIWRDLIEHEAQASTGGEGQRRLHTQRMFAEAENVPCRTCEELQERGGCKRICTRFDHYVNTGKKQQKFPRLRE